MRLTIEYNSSWQNSFLSGDDCLPISKDNKRKFIATSRAKEHITKTISKDTVIGVLCRLMGDQRKLYQIKGNSDYYFKDIEGLISFEVKKERISTETAFIINKGDNRPAQNTFLGIIPDDTKLFYSKTAPQLWSVLYLELNDLLNFIVSGNICNKNGSSLPRDLLFRIDDIKNKKIEAGRPVKTLKRELQDISNEIEKEKKKFEKQKDKFCKHPEPTKKQVGAFKAAKRKHNDVINKLQETFHKAKNSKTKKAFDRVLSKTFTRLSDEFPETTYLKDGVVDRIGLYSAALYLQAKYMRTSGYNMDYCLNKRGNGIQGFSKCGFNGVRDFINPLTGSKRKTVGTPFPLSKSDGTLEININVDKKRSGEIKQLIENAGVSSFYLGKKGLAYVSNIRI